VAQSVSLPHNDMRKIVFWMICLPALSFWPFTSTFPIFALLDGAESATAIGVHLLFLVTGFWTFLVGALLVSFLKTEEARRRQSASRQPRALQLGFFATVWSLAYMAAALLL
jgi:hypothetical protein